MFLEKNSNKYSVKTTQAAGSEKIQKYLGCSLMERLNLCCFVELNLVVVSGRRCQLAALQTLEVPLDDAFATVS